MMRCDEKKTVLSLLLFLDIYYVIFFHQRPLQTTKDILCLQFYLIAKLKPIPPQVQELTNTHTHLLDII